MHDDAPPIHHRPQTFDAGSAASSATTASLADAVSPGAADLPADERLKLAIDAVRGISMARGANEMIRDFEQRTRWQMASERWIAISRRGLSDGWYRITRSTEWADQIDPWREPHRLPLLQGGLIGELIYSDQPTIINNLSERMQPDDPAAPHLGDAQSLMAVHHFDDGHGLNMAVMLTHEPNAFDFDKLPEQVLVHNLFGRVVKVHLLRRELQEAHDELDRELRVVGELQRSLLPTTLPDIPGLDLAASYDTARRAGGDYYDIFRLNDDAWGILIADVSGHGTPAAVLMSVMHAIAHGFTGPHDPAGSLLEYVNERLTKAYTGKTGNFVTAFYGVYQPSTRNLTYAIAGHPPPRLLRQMTTCFRTAEPATADGDMASRARVNSADPGNPMMPMLLEIREPAGPPLGVLPGVQYEQGRTTIDDGDVLVLYTDGITEAMNANRELYGVDRLDQRIAKIGCSASQDLEHQNDQAGTQAGMHQQRVRQNQPTNDAVDGSDPCAHRYIDAIHADVERFADGEPLADDRTLLILRGVQA